MTNKLRFIEWRRGLIAGCLLLCLLTATAQSLQDEGRKLWDTAHNKNLSQPSPGGQAAGTPPARSKRNYRKATPQTPSEQVAADTVVGVTLWLLQPAPASDPTEARLLVQQGAQKVSYTPQRIEAETRLVEGQQVRLSIEAARAGYIYVINREEYRDGTFSEPYLIFPTDRTYRHDNRVSVGRVIEVPSQLDNPPYFTLRPSRPDQVGESISVLVTAQPLKLPKPLEPDPITLPPSLFAEWEQTWGQRIGRFELESGRGQEWTAEERDAGADGSRKLTQDEPYPQSLYYRAGAKAGEPVLVTIPLRYAPQRPPVPTPAPNPAPAPWPTPPKIWDTLNKWTLQIGSFDQIAEARKEISRLQAMRIDARVEPINKYGRTWHRVQIGRFPNREEAERYGGQLLAEGKIQEFIVAKLFQ